MLVKIKLRILIWVNIIRILIVQVVNKFKFLYDLNYYYFEKTQLIAEEFYQPDEYVVIK